MLRIGLIGCGYIARKHVQTIARFNDLSLEAVCDIDPHKMEEIVKLYHLQKGDNIPISFYQNYQNILADPKIDTVVISVVSSLHAEIANKAIKNNKHVIVEKPLALSLYDSEKVINAAQKYGKKVMVCHQLRYRPSLQKIKEFIQKGYFGKLYYGVVTLMLNRSPEYYDLAKWRGTWKKDGGMLINQGIHLVDLLLWMMGDVQSIYGKIATTIENKETEDIAIGMIHFESGAKGLIEANTITKPKNLGYYLSIFGEKGSVRIGGKSFDQIEHCYSEDFPDLVQELEKLGEGYDEHYLMYQNFYRSIQTSEDLLMTAEEGKRALEGIFSLYKSSQKNQPVYFPIKKFSTIDMLEKE